MLWPARQQPGRRLSRQPTRRVRRRLSGQPSMRRRPPRPRGRRGKSLNRALASWLRLPPGGGLPRTGSGTHRGQVGGSRLTDVGTRPSCTRMPRPTDPQGVAPARTRWGRARRHTLRLGSPTKARIPGSPRLPRRHISRGPSASSVPSPRYCCWWPGCSRSCTWRVDPRSRLRRPPPRRPPERCRLTAPRPSPSTCR